MKTGTHRQRDGDSPVLRVMETRATLRPGQKGTHKLVVRFGERLVRVRYLHGANAGRRYKTVERIVSSAPWRPKPRNPRRRNEDIVAVRIGYHETDLRQRAKRLGAVWRPIQRLWEITWLDAKRPGLSDRVVAPAPDPKVPGHAHLPA